MMSGNVLLLVVLLVGPAVVVKAFVVVPTLWGRRSLFRTSSLLDSPSPEQQEETDDDSDSAIQWELFQKHHARGSWKGIWTTYNYIGDIQDETVASVDLDLVDNNDDDDDDDNKMIQHTHHIVVGAKRSDCATCFDSMDVKTIPVATYTRDNLRKLRFAACSMVNGPTLLRSGAMATELVLRHGDGRVRVIFQHAPVWERGVEPGSCPPQGLKLFRTMISREATRETAPTAETEVADPPSPGNPIFYRPVPPFDWHKKWSGTSWTWGPQAGNRGWSIAELEEEDSWHGSAPVEAWNLRLPGGIFLQAPRVITDAEVGLSRLAWMPDQETLLRVEAGVVALQPMMFLDDETLAGFEPPSLASLRCDIMEKVGDLEGEPQFAQQASASNNESVESMLSSSSGQGKAAANSTPPEKTSTSFSRSAADDDDQAIRDALQL